MRLSNTFLTLLLTSISNCAVAEQHDESQSVLGWRKPIHGSDGGKAEFLDKLVAKMTIPELVLQVHLMFAESLIGEESTDELYDHALRFSPGASIGVLHDWYPQNKTNYNEMQKLNSDKSRLKIPFMQFGECLHGVGSFKQSMFPQSIGLAASFDTGLVYRVGRAIGTEARSIGIHACLSPVLDLGLEPRWGRVQEAFGEDTLLTSHMGVAMASGLSKNGSWSDPDAVMPVMKHFAAHGSSEGGINGAPATLRGTRQLMMNMLRPFKAVVDLGGVRGVMMAYNELDDIPAHVHPMLYKALEDWGFNGFVTADDNGMNMLQFRHNVSGSAADTIAQWFNAGGMIQYYDFPLDEFLEITIDLIEQEIVAKSTLQSHVRKILDAKYDLGLFEDPYIPDHIDPSALTAADIPLTLEAAHKSIVLLENRNDTLPLKPTEQKLSSIALIGPFADTLNYGDYSGQFGSAPAANSSTLRQAMESYLQAHHPHVSLSSSWGANSWEYNAQYPIPNDLLRYGGVPGGLMATYYADTEFEKAIFQKQEVPSRDWGLYPPVRLPSRSFSVVWEGELSSPAKEDVNGWIGVATTANITTELYINDKLVVASERKPDSTILSNIEPLEFIRLNSTQAPPGGASFTFSEHSTYKIKLKMQVFHYGQKTDNVQGVKAQVELFWNLVDRKNSITKAVEEASKASVIILAIGASWTSDGEGGDRSTLSLSPSQTALTSAIFALGKPVVMVLQGGRPFAIPEYYAQAAAVITTFFPGQRGGEAICDVLFGKFNPGGRLPISIPRSVGTLPNYYSQKNTAHFRHYLDEDWRALYPFGYGLSYSSFLTTSFAAHSTSSRTTFSSSDTIIFSVTITNTGHVAGSYVAQVYLLQRVSVITQPLQQLVAFQRVYLEPGEDRRIQMELEVDRYLPILDRKMKWVLEKGEYVFVLAEGSGVEAEEKGRVVLESV